MPIGPQVGPWVSPIVGPQVGIPAGRAGGARPGGTPSGFIILGGQSNMSGQGDFAKADSGLGLGTAFAAVTMRAHQGVSDPITWTDTITEALQPYAASGGASMGPELTFGRYINKYNGWAAPITPKMSVFGTGLAACWLPGVNYPTSPIGGDDLYKQLLAFIRARQTEFGKYMDALVWLQGESDATNSANSLAYAANLTTFFGALRTAIGFNFPVVMMKLSPTTTATFRDNVRAQQVTYAASDPKCALVDCDDVPLTNDPHYDAPALCTIGERLAAGALSLLKPGWNNTIGTGPSPYLVGADTGVTGAGNLTPRWHTGHQAGDIAILVATGANLNAAITLVTAAGFVEITGSPEQSNFSTSFQNLAVFWCRADSTTMAGNVGRMPSPTLAFGNTLNACRIFVIRGCVATGNPFDVTSVGANLTNNTVITIASGTTSKANCLMMAIGTANCGGAPAITVSGWTNASVTNFAQFQTSQYQPSSNHQVIATAFGTKAVAGAYNATSATLSGNGVSAGMMIALTPT